MKKLLFLAIPLLLAVPAFADSPAPEAPSAPAANWLDSRGLLSTDDVLDILGAKATPEQRADIEKALAKRNETVANANASLSSTLKKVLAADDNKMASENKDAVRLDKVRRLQPSRYREIQKQVEKDKAEREKAAGTK